MGYECWRKTSCRHACISCIWLVKEGKKNKMFPIKIYSIFVNITVTDAVPSH